MNTKYFLEYKYLYRIMLSININKLRSEVELREQRKIKIYENILDLCYQRILNSNKQNDDYSCTYIVPIVVFGLPLYDVNECVSFIMNKLVEKQFKIVYAFPTTIHISWKPDDKINNKYENNKHKQLSITSQSQKNIEDKGDREYRQYKEDRGDKRDNIKKIKNYKSIDDYTQSKSLIYDTDDINLFQSKLDNLFN